MLKTPMNVADGLPPLGSPPHTSGVRTGTYSTDQTDQTNQSSSALPHAGGIGAARAAAQRLAEMDREPAGRETVWREQPQSLWEVFVEGVDQAIKEIQPPLPLEGLPAAIGVEIPLTHRVGDYLGQPRVGPEQRGHLGYRESNLRDPEPSVAIAWEPTHRVPEQVLAAKIDELDAIERVEDQAATGGGGSDVEANEEAGDGRGGLGGLPTGGDQPGGARGLLAGGVPEGAEGDAGRAAGPDPAGGERDRTAVAVEDPVCPHGVALDVHCCECHSGFQFDPAHVCPAPAEVIVPVDLWPAPCPAFTYLAGAAGSGKTFAVKEWQARERGLMLLATTGIAALNLGGTTVNAALGYFDTKSLQDSYIGGYLSARIGRLWRSGVRRLILDEVSMLEGDALTYIVKGVEETNQKGYVLGKWIEDEDSEPPAMGLTLVGDFAQLRPVEGTWAWESPEWNRFAEEGHTITLTEIRRQADPAFVEMLRQARVGNGRAVLDYMRGRIHPTADDHFQGPTLFAKNAEVDKYNWIRLGRVQGEDAYFESRREGDQRSEWGNPKKPPYTWGIPLRLHTKIGAQVMILANERYEGPPPQPFLYVNGDLGTVVQCSESSCWVQLQRNDDVVEVTFVRREVLVPIDSARRRELRDLGKQDKISENGKFEITGWVEYMPIRIAYASTVHKSQGLSLDAVQVNIRDHFFKTPGMLYVALSRARTSEGLRLVGSEAALVERCAADPRLQPWL